jgi:hypothetical protein
MYLVLIETSGNQDYIFSTNKLRENVGASELTYRVGTEWLVDAVGWKDAHGNSLWDEKDPEALQRILLDPKLNPPIEDDGQAGVEVIIATSGKALLLVTERKTGQDIVERITTKALEEAPVLDVCGVISDVFSWDDYPIWNVVRGVHEMFEEVRAERPGPALRFLRLPVVDECATSGLPAKEWHVPSKKDGIRPAARSAATLAKWNFRQAYKKRMNALLDHYEVGMSKFADNVDHIARQLEERTEWLAVIHADGNGLGQMFLKFHEYAGCESGEDGKVGKANRKYVDKLRAFSLALDLCTATAFMNVVRRGRAEYGWFERDEKMQEFRLPLLPIVLGGDDLTVVCDGRCALDFTREFLTELETETARTDHSRESDKGLYDTLQDVAEKATEGARRLSSCAGVAIVKPHYPFSGAYEIAQALIQSAKHIKEVVKHPDKPIPWPASALDFHINYDTSGNDLERIRQDRLTLTEPDEGEVTGKREIRLYSRPYLVSDADRLARELRALDVNAQEACEWIDRHRWSRLQSRVDMLIAEDEEGRRKLPNSQAHELRAGLFLGTRAANARYKLIRHRYEDAGIEAFDGDEERTLFEREPDPAHRFSVPVYVTKLLDALDLASLYERKSSKNGKPAKGGK